jgi:thiamine-phosphate pyrophosphorylase
MASLTELARRLKLTLVAVTDERRGGDPLAVATRLPAGSWVILRHYQAPERSILAMRLTAICRKRRLKLLVAGDPPLAKKLKAGLHLPDTLAASPTPVIRLWRGLLTAAAHDRQGLRRAAKLGADAALLSPVFSTLSHPGAKPLGLLAFRSLARSAEIPVIALGGIDRTTVSLLGNTPIAGIAAVGGFRISRHSPLGG